MRKLKFKIFISVLIVLLAFVPPFLLNGCAARRRERFTKKLAAKLISKSIDFSPEFAVPYSKAVSAGDDKFYAFLLNNKYIKFHRKAGYTSFTDKLKSFLFKQADRTYVRMGKFKIGFIKIKSVTKKAAIVAFDFKFKPNELYKAAYKLNIRFNKFYKIIKSGKSGALFKFKPFLGWQAVKFKAA